LIKPATVISFEKNRELAKDIADQLKSFYSQASVHTFPDGETSVQIDTEKIESEVLLVCSLDHPNKITLPLLFLAETLRDYGARHIILIAPYLAYLRQDHRFQAGESISAWYYASLLSRYFDALVTVEPHLHRIDSLGEIFKIASYRVEAAHAVGEWISQNIETALVIGPDRESERWTRQLAEIIEAPYLVLEKTRISDHQVEVTVPDISPWRDHVPVLYDDIISTGKTMLETIKQLKKTEIPSPVCIGIHGILPAGSHEELIHAGAAKVVTTNTVSHETNAINIAGSIAEVIIMILNR